VALLRVGHQLKGLRLPRHWPAWLPLLLLLLLLLPFLPRTQPARLLRQILLLLLLHTFDSSALAAILPSAQHQPAPPLLVQELVLPQQLLLRHQEVLLQEVPHPGCRAARGAVRLPALLQLILQQLAGQVCRCSRDSC
jgi:hypothetical protein